MNYRALPCFNTFVDNEIAFYRGKFGYTQQYVADYVHVSVNTVSSWERLEYVPDLCHAYTLAELFGVSIDDIFWPSGFFKHSDKCLDCDHFSHAGCLLEHDFLITDHAVTIPR